MAQRSQARHCGLMVFRDLGIPPSARGVSITWTLSLGWAAIADTPLGSGNRIAISSGAWDGFFITDQQTIRACIL